MQKINMHKRNRTIYPHLKNAISYVKLADAYAAEKEAIGTFSQIGYVPPGTKQQAGGYLTTTFSYTETQQGDEGAYTNEVWTATAQGKMNDCAANSTWTVTTTLTAAENTATTGTLTHVAAVNGDNCEVLTPSFTKIGNSQ